MFMKLQGHYVERNGPDIAVAGVTTQVRLGDGTDVEIPVPFVTVGHRLAVCPVIDASGESGVRIDFSWWKPLYYTTDPAHPNVMFPISFRPQSVAVQVARAFDADPATRWLDRPADMLAWLRTWWPRTWGPANGVNVTGEGGS